MKKSLFIATVILLYMFNPVTGFSQSVITGKVTASNGTGLPYATVRVLKDSIQTYFAVSDSTGNFRLTINDKIPEKESGYFIRASYLKLTSALQALDTQNSLLLVIPDSADLLKTVTVTASRSVFKQKGDRFVFVPNKFLAEGSNGLEIMRIVPLVRYDEARDVFSIIGKSGTIVYINNKKTQIPKEAIIELLRALPAENIKNIEIITNPGSEYAANITGGIININIRRQVFEGWLGNLAIQSLQGFYNMTILNGSVNYCKGKFTVQLIPMISNNYNFNTSENTLEYADGLSNKIHTRFHRRYFVLGGGLNVDYSPDSKNLFSYNGWISDVSGKSNTSSFTDFSKTNQRGSDSVYSAPVKGTDTYIYNFGNFNYHHDFDSSGNRSLDYNIDYNDFSQRRKNDGSFNKLNAAGSIIKESGKYRNDLPQKFFNLSQKIEYTQQLKKDTKLSMGVQYSNTKTDNDLHYFYFNGSAYVPDNGLSNDFYYTEKYWSGFVSVNKDLNAKWSSGIGMRIEHTEYSTQKRNLNIKNDSGYTNFFPSLSVNYSPAQKHQLGFSFSRKISRPNWELLFPGRIYRSVNFFSENNPFLQPSIIYNSQLSYTLNSKYSFIFDYSHTDNSYTNFILPVVENNTAGLKSTYLNYGSVNSFGLTVNLNQAFFKGIYEVNLTPSINYSMYKGKDPANPVRLENTSFNGVLNNTIYISKKRKWTAFLTFTYRSRNKDISSALLNSVSSLDIVIKKVVNKFSFYLIAGDIFNGDSKTKNKFVPDPLLTKNLVDNNTYNRLISFKVRYKFGNTRLRSNKSRGTANDEIRRRVN